MSQRVRSAVLRLNVQGPEIVSYQRGHRPGGQRIVWRSSPERPRMIRFGARQNRCSVRRLQRPTAERIQLRLPPLQSEYLTTRPRQAIDRGATISPRRYACRKRQGASRSRDHGRPSVNLSAWAEVGGRPSTLDLRATITCIRPGPRSPSATRGWHSPHLAIYRKNTRSAAAMPEVETRDNVGHLCTK